MIAIQVTDRDPRRASQIAQAYVDELDHLVAEVSTSSARRERIFIEQRLGNVKRELDRASQEFSQFASQNATLDITSQGKAMVEAASRLQGELIASQSELESLEQLIPPATSAYAACKPASANLTGNWTSWTATSLALR